MKYKFPEIHHINDVLPVIENKEEFIVADKGDYKVVNYLVNKEDTFPIVSSTNHAILRECRGLVFDKDGVLIARRLHKFFNVNEREETSTEFVDLSQPHVILEKLDGSMITPIPFGWKYRLGTKMGITDVSMNAEVFVATRPNYDEFIHLCLDRNHTPIFEWCSRRNRIVIDYPEDRLVLIGVRHNNTGEYYSYKQLVNYAEDYSIDCVRCYPGTVYTMQQLINNTRYVEGKEGWVVRFDDGHMVKIKGDWYVSIHKAKDVLTQEKNIIELIINEKIDDFLPLLLEEDRKRVKAFNDRIWDEIEKTKDKLNDSFKMLWNHCGGDRKRFAVTYANDYDPMIRALLFRMWDGHDPFEEIVILVKKHLSSSTRVEKVRLLFGGIKWDYEGVEE